MNDQATAVAVEAPTKAKRPETVIESVKMTDGRVVDFPGKKIMIKSSYEAEDGSLAIRVDWRNGETRVFPLNPKLLSKFALHGAEQKYGDEIAGMKDDKGNDADIDDKILAVDELHERLNGPDAEWTTKREGDGLAGTSILLQAMVEVTGKSKEGLQAFLKTKTQKQKMAFRDSDMFRGKVQELEAARAAKRAKVDITADLDELNAIPAA